VYEQSHLNVHVTAPATSLQARNEMGDDMDDLLSAPRLVLHQFVERHFPDGTKGSVAGVSLSTLQRLFLDVRTATAAAAAL
jgi:hypothetical protein